MAAIGTIVALLAAPVATVVGVAVLVGFFMRVAR